MRSSTSSVCCSVQRRPMTFRAVAAAGGRQKSFGFLPNRKGICGWQQAKTEKREWVGGSSRQHLAALVASTQRHQTNQHRVWVKALPRFFYTEGESTYSAYREFTATSTGFKQPRCCTRISHSVQAPVHTGLPVARPAVGLDKAGSATTTPACSCRHVGAPAHAAAASMLTLRVDTGVCRLWA